MDWVSGQLDRSVALFTRLLGVPKFQVAVSHKFPDGLHGYRGASAFDFYHNRYRNMPAILAKQHPGDADSNPITPRIPVDSSELEPSVAAYVTSMVI